MRVHSEPLLEVLRNHLSKADVRGLAKAWGLPTWDKPATPCLSSRIAYGEEVTPERGRRIDQAAFELGQGLIAPVQRGALRLMSRQRCVANMNLRTDQIVCGRQFGDVSENRRPQALLWMIDDRSSGPHSPPAARAHAHMRHKCPGQVTLIVESTFQSDLGQTQPGSFKE